MSNSLYIGATGMQAQQKNLDAIANNLTNTSTIGYKKSKVSFSEIVTSESGRNNISPLSAADFGLIAPAYRQGGGVNIAGMTKVFDQGDIKKTDSALDIAIQGDGFLEVIMPDGRSGYTRGGTLKVNADGQLSTQSGYAIKSSPFIPDQTQQIVISNSGHVQAVVAGQVMELGQLDLVRFANPELLAAQGDNLYTNTAKTGEPILGRAGEEGMGTFAQGHLEISNVKMVDEIVNMMVAQRAYEASVKIVQASDELMGMINNMRK